MTKKSLIWMLIIIPLVVISGCGTSKKARETVGKPDASPEASALISQVIKSRIDEQWMNARARVTAELNGGKYDVTAQIRMKKDEVIWVTVRKLGFELARIYITNDTILALNRLDRSYMLYTMSEFSDLIGFPVNLEILQELVVGNPYLQNSIEVCHNKIAGKACVAGKDQYIMSELFFNLPDLTLSESNMLDVIKQRILHSKFQQYQSIKDNKNFSYFRTYQLQSDADESMFVEIRFTDLEWNSPFEYNMDIPARYSRM